MKYSEEIIEAILKKMGASCTGSEIAKHLAKELAAIDSIRRSISDNMLARQEIEKRRKKELAELDEALSKVYERCPHYVKHRQGDPSGGSDRSITCEICEKEFC